MIKIDLDKCCWKDGKCTTCNCGGCEGCVEACPLDAITREDIVKIDNDKCSDCGACVDACKHGALSME